MAEPTIKPDNTKTEDDISNLIERSGDTVQINAKANQRVFGSTNEHFIKGIVGQVINAGSQGQKIDDEGTAFFASMIGGVNPKDELEGMLAAQMAAIHNATMTFARRLAHVDTIAQQDSAERALNKLARTFTLQMQTLQKYRSGGKQKVVVKHVHVNEGGQAIVGNVETGGGR